MKRTYIQPAMMAAKLQSSGFVCTSITSFNSNNADLGYGGSDEDYIGDVRVKERNLWDDEW